MKVGKWFYGLSKLSNCLVSSFMLFKIFVIYFLIGSFGTLWLDSMSKSDAVYNYLNKTINGNGSFVNIHQVTILKTSAPLITMFLQLLHGAVIFIIVSIIVGLIMDFCLCRYAKENGITYQDVKDYEDFKSKKDMSKIWGCRK